MDAHNVSALCVESLFHTSEERTKEIDLGALADLPDTLQVLREMASSGTESTMYQIRLLQQKVTDLEALVAAATAPTATAATAAAITTTAAAPNADAPAKTRFSGAAAPSSS